MDYRCVYAVKNVMLKQDWIGEIKGSKWRKSRKKENNMKFPIVPTTDKNWRLVRSDLPESVCS